MPVRGIVVREKFILVYFKLNGRFQNTHYKFCGREYGTYMTTVASAEWRAVVNFFITAYVLRLKGS